MPKRSSKRDKLHIAVWFIRAGIRAVLTCDIDAVDSNVDSVSHNNYWGKNTLEGDIKRYT